MHAIDKGTLAVTRSLRAAERKLPVGVPEGTGRLSVIDSWGRAGAVEEVLARLRRDDVVLVRNVGPELSDLVLYSVAQALQLQDRLELQAGFAEVQGHRQRVGKYRMTVNRRKQFQFIPPHSEGDSFANMQLCAFYCFENSTDGGESILMNVDGASAIWQSLREKITILAPGSRSLTAAELRRATALYHLHPAEGPPTDAVILAEHESAFAGVKILEVLAKPRRTRSVILGRDLYAYWDSIASIDSSSAAAYVDTIRESRLLRTPSEGFDLARMDNAAGRRLWSSGVDHRPLFRCKVTRKLERGDLILQNNLTWAHAAANWTPGSGIRNISAAFA